MEQKQNIWDLEGKIDWEGGYEAALEYGISIDEYEVPESLKEAWDELEEAHGEFLVAVNNVQYEIDKAKSGPLEEDEV